MSLSNEAQERGQKDSTPQQILPGHIHLSSNTAITACKAIGAHLINNAEWMAIARDARLVSSNWAERFQLLMAKAILGQITPKPLLLVALVMSTTQQ